MKRKRAAILRQDVMLGGGRLGNPAPPVRYATAEDVLRHNLCPWAYTMTASGVAVSLENGVYIRQKLDEYGFNDFPVHIACS